MTRHTARTARATPGKVRVVARYSIAAGLKGPRGKTPDEVVLPFDDFETMRDALEDRLDLAEARALIARLKPEELIPLEVIEAELKGMSVLRAWRKARGLTLVELAGRVGLSQPYLSEL
ncbi:MAG: XRE family transcriptional regulator, partial [Alphaproteobacteria bacterium]|nr:XRE family transcriptional regulator [Alphaproteobacteria bacterium]